MDRRRLPRYVAWISCSVLLNATAEGEATPKQILGRTHNLNREALAIILPSNQTYGIDPAFIGTGAKITLALPDGYLTLQCSFLRHEPRGAEGNLVVFLIDEENEQYLKHLETLVN